MQHTMALAYRCLAPPSRRPVFIAHTRPVAMLRTNYQNHHPREKTSQFNSTLNVAKSTTRYCATFNVFIVNGDMEEPTVMSMCT